MLYVNMDECTSCTACYQPDVCPVGAIYTEEDVPDGADEDEVQRRRPEQGPRPHVLHPAQPGRLRRLTKAVLLAVLVTIDQLGIRRIGLMTSPDLESARAVSISVIS